MNNPPQKGYDGVKPAPGRDDSGLDPFEIEFKPELRGNRGPEKPFINAHGVVIGDHVYASPESPLERWTEHTDPAVMSGEQWVHPYKDIGFRSRDNRDLFEKGIAPQGGGGERFMHSEIQVSSADEPSDGGKDRDEAEMYDWLDPDEEYVIDEP